MRKLKQSVRDYPDLYIVGGIIVLNAAWTIYAFKKATGPVTTLS